MKPEKVKFIDLFIRVPNYLIATLIQLVLAIIIVIVIVSGIEFLWWVFTKQDLVMIITDFVYLIVGESKE